MAETMVDLKDIKDRRLSFLLLLCKIILLAYKSWFFFLFVISLFPSFEQNNCFSHKNVNRKMFRLSYHASILPLDVKYRIRG
jgi:hypothetical protein